jgi:hypothetical protein
MTVTEHSHGIVERTVGNGNREVSTCTEIRSLYCHGASQDQWKKETQTLVGIA